MAICFTAGRHITAGQGDYGDQIGGGPIRSDAWLTYHPFGCFPDDLRYGWFPLSLEEAEITISAQQVAPT